MSLIDDPTNICILHFGQLGDVLLALPAIHALRQRFSNAKITLIAGKTAAHLVEDLKILDEVVAVDRVALLRGKKLRSIGQIFRLIGDVRGRKFDFVIDLHSLNETNLLGFLSGAKTRLYANRESRSLDRLSNFHPNPPREDKSVSLADNYLKVLEPLGIENAERFVRIDPQCDVVEQLSGKFGLTRNSDRISVGMIVGAGHRSRRWPLEKFAKLAHRLVQLPLTNIFVFLGPEEASEEAKVTEMFPDGTTIINGLKLSDMAAAFSLIDVLISNDTGPPHLAALVGTPIVLIIDERGSLRFLPLSPDIEIVRTTILDEISVQDVFNAVERVLSKKWAEKHKEPEKYQPNQRQKH